MPGPPPKPASERRRRNAAPGTVLLPAHGRRGRAPKWPLGGIAPTLWAELWRTPQAAAWERLGYTRSVARYAMLLELVEGGENHHLLAEVRQMEDRLGLTPMAMLRLRWEIVADEMAERRASKAPARPVPAVNPSRPIPMDPTAV